MSMSITFTFFISSLIIILITLSDGVTGVKSGATFGLPENISPVYCTNDWMCKTYCAAGRIAYCPSINKMGPEVKYGTCFCCDDALGYLEQSAFACSSSCSQVIARIMVEFKAPQACPDKNGGGYFSWFGSNIVRQGQDPHGMVKKEKEEQAIKVSM